MSPEIRWEKGQRRWMHTLKHFLDRKDLVHPRPAKGFQPEHWEDLLDDQQVDLRQQWISTAEGSPSTRIADAEAVYGELTKLDLDFAFRNRLQVVSRDKKGVPQTDTVGPLGIYVSVRMPGRPDGDLEVKTALRRNPEGTARDRIDHICEGLAVLIRRYVEADGSAFAGSMTDTDLYDLESVLLASVPEGSLAWRLENGDGDAELRRRIDLSNAAEASSP